MNNITINRRNSPNLEYIKQCHLNKILFINVNENNQIFNDYTTFITKFEEHFNKTKFKKYYIIIVCSQKSISGKGGVHFQHYFKDFIKKNSFTLMSKIDATIPSNKIIKKLSNVRTRIYYNDFYVRFLFDLKKFKYSYGKSFVNSTSNKNIRESTENYRDILKIEGFEPVIVIKNYKLSRKTTDSNHGIIAICLDFLLKINNNKENDIFRLIVTNSDLKDNDEIDPNMFINGLKLNNNTEILNFPNNNNNNLDSISINIGNNNNLFTTSFQQPNLNNIYNYKTNPRLLVQINDTEVILESLYDLFLKAKNNNDSINIVLKHIKYLEILNKYKSKMNFDYIIDYYKKIKNIINKFINKLNEEKKKILKSFNEFPSFAIQTSVEFPPVNMKINKKSSRNSIRISNSSRINNNYNGNQSLGKDIKVYIYL